MKIFLTFIIFIGYLFSSDINLTTKECMQLKYSHQGFRGNFLSKNYNKKEILNKYKSKIPYTKDQALQKIKKNYPNLKIKNIKLVIKNCSLLYRVCTDEKVLYFDPKSLSLKRSQK